MLEWGMWVQMVALGVIFFRIWFLSLTKVSNHNLKTSIAWLGWEVCRGLRLEVNNKISNVQQNVGLVLIFSG
jgi:hypothetical protein